MIKVTITATDNRTFNRIGRREHEIEDRTDCKKVAKAIMRLKKLDKLRAIEVDDERIAIPEEPTLLEIVNILYQKHLEANAKIARALRKESEEQKRISEEILTRLEAEIAEQEAEQEAQEEAEQKLKTKREQELKAKQEQEAKTDAMNWYERKRHFINKRDFENWKVAKEQGFESAVLYAQSYGFNLYRKLPQEYIADNVYDLYAFYNDADDHWMITLLQLSTGRYVWAQEYISEHSPLPRLDMIVNVLECGAETAVNMLEMGKYINEHAQRYGSDVIDNLDRYVRETIRRSDFTLDHIYMIPMRGGDR